VVARLSRLGLDRVAENPALQKVAEESSAPMPDIDLLVDEFRFGDWHLGRLRVSGTNAGARRWTLRELVLENPDATLRADGEWERQLDAAVDAKRRMTLHGAWQVRDLGKL